MRFPSRRIVLDVKIDGHNLTIEEAVSIAAGENSASLSDKARVRMELSRKGVEKIIASDDIVYGINTGFGAMSSVKIDSEDL